MKIRLLSIISAVVMLLTLAVGCAGTGTSNPSGGSDPVNENIAQLVVAINPIFVYDDGETVIGYNDIKNAAKADFEAATLTALHQNTAWDWMYKIPDNWKKRAIHTLDNWQNGSGAQAKSAFAYAFNAEGTTSLASYYAQSTALTAYNEADTVPDYGLLLSVSGGEEEALTYTVQKDGILNIAEGAVTAIRSVAGVNTGFLAEDGTARSASVRVLVNGEQVVSGTLCNSTASPDGVAVTSIDYGQITDLQVEAGNVVMIAVKLNATANKDEDRYTDKSADGGWQTVGKEVQVPITGDESTGSSETGEALTILDDYLSRFVIVRSNELSMDMREVAGALRSDMEYILDTEVLMHNETHDEEVYEIVVGPIESRPESVKIYEELLNYRANNANDYLIRRVGSKVYIVASNAPSLKQATAYFLQTFCQSDRGAIPADYNYAYQAQTVPASIGGTGIGNFVIRVEKHPSTIVQLAAEELQTWVKEHCGYLLPITPMTDDGKHYDYEVRVGPMNGSVKVDRAYDTRYSNATTVSVGKFSVDANGFLNGKAPGYYKAAMSGGSLTVNGGSAYAVSAAMQIICDTLEKKGSLPAGYSLEGTYKAGSYALVDGYDAAWVEEFSYDTTRSNAELDKEIREYYTISSDTTSGPTAIGVKANGEPIWDSQKRPGLYGENWWIWSDSATGNGYLLEITKKESYGYDAVRLISQNKWTFRYGIWETRIVVGTRNGACSAVWASTGAPDNSKLRNEIDVYENFGRDTIIANYHTWATDLGEGHRDHSCSCTTYPHSRLTPAEGEHYWDTFHSISIVWTPEDILFYWDGAVFDHQDIKEVPSGQVSTTIKFANGVGTGTYGSGYQPYDWMNEAYTAATGKTVEDFFEVQTIDFSYILQTSNEGKNANQQSFFKYDRSHPNSPHYSGYLKDTAGFVSAQLP